MEGCHSYVVQQKKGNFYKVAIKPVMLFGFECWLIRKAQEHNLEAEDENVAVDM